MAVVSGAAIVLVCVALAAPVFAFAARATQTVIVRKDSSGSATATCPKGEHVSFGGLIAQFVPPPNAPGRPAVFPEGMRRTAPNRWTVIGESAAIGTGSRLTSIAYCDRGSVPAAAAKTVSLAAHHTASVTATCPAGTVVVGGGFKSGASPQHQELLSQLQATSSTQWRVTMRNIAKFPTTLTALAYCSAGPAPTLHSATAALPGEKGGTARASCPNGTALVFGGLLAVSPGSGVDSADIEPFSFSAPSTKQWVVGGYNAGARAGSLEALAYCR
jgi:hypothetical protein